MIGCAALGAVVRCGALGAVTLAFAGLVGAESASQPPAGASAPSTAPASTPSPVPAPPPTPPPPPALSNDEASYLFGLTFGESLHGIGLDKEVIPDAVLHGMKDALAGKKSTPAERQQVQEFARSVIQATAARNKAAAQDFLAKNGHEKGVHTTESGLEYKIIKTGDPKAPLIGATDEVTVNYRGKLIDGSEFDSSYAHGTPATFPVNGVIKGWQEALQLMKPGAVWELYVPPELAYGQAPRPGIPANSLLIFTVEVLSDKPKQTAAPGAPPPGAPPAPAAAPRGGSAPPPGN
jgi:FKBP-type peptidyl-prolyl cis-trans isomerase FklB